MEKIWIEEIRKIASRKFIWCGLTVLIAVIAIRLYLTVQYEYSATIDGHTYHGREAIEKDQKLTREYAGPLTEQKVKEIYERFGFYYTDEKTSDSMGNYCNRFITERMTNYRQMDEDNPKKVNFMQGKEWENNVSQLVKGNLRFDYVYGWDDLLEIQGTFLILMLSVILMIGLSPVFAEEYSLRTADLLLTTDRGKKAGIWVKIMAAITFCAGVYIVLLMIIWLMYLSVFGTQGLDASAVMLEGVVQKVEIGRLFLGITVLGLGGILLLAAMTLAISALCRNAFMSVIISLLFFLFPIVWIKIIAPMRILGRAGTIAVNHFMISMPVYLAVNYGFGLRESKEAVHLVIALAVAAVCALLGYRRYRSYQGI